MEEHRLELPFGFDPRTALPTGALIASTDVGTRESNRGPGPGAVRSGAGDRETASGWRPRSTSSSTANPKTIVGREIGSIKAHFVDPQTGQPRTDNILKAAGVVVAVVGFFVVVRRVVR